MARFGGIYAIQLFPEIDPQTFETFMINEVFPATIELFSSSDREQSGIESQHLLRLAETSRTYLWLIKSRGTLTMPRFTHVFHSIYGTVHERLSTFGNRISAATFVVAGRFGTGSPYLSVGAQGERHCDDEREHGEKTSGDLLH
ncbi:MAG: hypothetical protein FJ147_06120 [Deltaproteobacteria bacterium]|nr:hypothetical protein [Deltaproteobacteria bacterium]